MNSLLTKGLIGLLPLLSSCAGSVASYPSLAPRTVEGGSPGTQAADATAVPLDAAVLARATALVAQAERGETAMADAVKGNCAAIARGLSAREGSEAWVAAQQRLSAVESARQETIAARDAIDALVLDQARLAEDRPRSTDLSPLLTAAQEIAMRDGAQVALLDAIRAGKCVGA